MQPRTAASLGLAFFMLALGAVRSSFAAETPRDPNATPVQVLTSKMREDLLRMNEFFDTMLPGTLAERNIVLKFNPKFSDLRDNEFIRFPFELRYGQTERLELFGGMTPYTPNPFNRGRDHRWGFGETRLGFRSFRVDRIQQLVVLDQRFRDEPGQTLADLFRSYESDAG